MDHYLEEINLYFELKATPESSKESYMRRLQAFIRFMQDRDKCMEELSEKDIQQYDIQKLDGYQEPTGYR